MSVIREIRESLLTRPHEFAALHGAKPNILRDPRDYAVLKNSLFVTMPKLHPALPGASMYGEIVKSSLAATFLFDKVIIEQYIRAARQRAINGHLLRTKENSIYHFANPDNIMRAPELSLTQQKLKALHAVAAYKKSSHSAGSIDNNLVRFY